MLLHANKRNSSTEPIKLTLRPRPPTLTIPKIRLKAGDSPAFRHEPLRPLMLDSPELRCQGMKLNARDLRSPEKVKKISNGRISKTVALIKQHLETINAPIFSSLQLKDYHAIPNFRRFSDNPEEIKNPKNIVSIPATHLLLSHYNKNADMHTKISFYTTMQRYTGLHPFTP